MSDPYYSLPYVSQSSLKTFMQSPVSYHYQHVLGLGRGGVKTAATNLGSIVHTMLLEPAEVDLRYQSYNEDKRPEADKSMASTKNKQWRASLIAAALDKNYQLVNSSTLDLADSMVQVVCAHQLASGTLWPGDDWQRHVELSICWQHECSDLQLKSKLDVLLVKVDAEKEVGEFTIVDYKTTSSANLQEFGWSVKKYGYDVQAAFYMDAAYAWLEEQYPKVEFTGKILFIPQRTVVPFQVLGVVQLSYATEQAARVRYTKALQELEGCLHTNIWEESGSIQVLDLTPVTALDMPFDYELPDIL